MERLPRMRTAEGILKELRSADPETAVSLWFLRGLIASGEIPVLQVGKKKLVDLDAVLEVLKKGGCPQPYEKGKIRRIDA